MAKTKRGGARMQTKKRERADGRVDGDDESVNKLSTDYYHDEVDQFHLERDKISLDTRFAGQKDDSASEEEVLAVDSGDSDDDDDDLDEEMTNNLSRLQRNLTNEEMASDIEDKDDEDDDDDLSKNQQAWGKMKHKFYGADVHDDDDVDSDESELGKALLEEQEALSIQKRLAQQLDDQDFGLDAFKPTTKLTGEKDEIIITKDLSKLTKREKLELLKKESPEFLELVEDYKRKMEEAQCVLHPVLMKIKSGELPSGAAANYVDVKFRLLLSYCVNVSFYLMLKAKHLPVHDHPVINRIVQFRGLLQQLEEADDEIKPNLDIVLEKIRNNEPLNQENKESIPKRTAKKTEPKTTASSHKLVNKKRKKVSELLDDSDSNNDDDRADHVMAKKKMKVENADKTRDLTKNTMEKKKKSDRFETRDEQAALDYYAMMKAGKSRGLYGNDGKSRDQDGGESSDDEDAARVRLRVSAASSGGDKNNSNDDDAEADLAGPGDDADDYDAGDTKRGITKQIAKNRGLTPHRNKDNKNPRVKHRKKYRKAKIRRKGAVREYRPETRRYGGELSGIRAGVKKSIKLK